jgi:hypothetical protein
MRGRKKESNNLKIRNHEHYRKSDKRCESKHLVRQQTGSKFFSSHQRELQKQKRRQGGADHLFRVRLLDKPKGCRVADQRHGGGAHWYGKRKGVDGKRRGASRGAELQYLQYQTARGRSEIRRYAAQ